MARTRQNPLAIRPAYFCDECGEIIFDSDGYLTVLTRGERNRWCVFHHSCREAVEIAGNQNGLRGPVLVQLNRVATYPLLLTTMASLASGLIGFEKTDWPTLFTRIASDSEWSRTDGRKRLVDLHDENRSKVTAALGAFR